MNLVQLQTFLTVARLGSFRKASDQLFTTQPAVSARIAGLEESLGVALFERRGGAVTLTAKGVELRPMAEKILGLAQDIKLRIGGTEAVAGIFRLGVAETIVHTWLHDFLKAVHDAFPELDFEISVDISVNLRDAVVSHDLDMAFLMGPVSEYSVSNVPLCRYPLIWVASPDVPIWDRPATLETVFSFPVLTYARATRPYSEISDKARDFAGGKPRIFGSTSLSAAKQMALEGMGVANLPEALVAEELRSGALKHLDGVWSPSDLLFTASYASEWNDRLTANIARMAQKFAAPYQSDNKKNLS